MRVRVRDFQRVGARADGACELEVKALYVVFVLTFPIVFPRSVFSTRGRVRAWADSRVEARRRLDRDGGNGRRLTDHQKKRRRKRGNSSSLSLSLSLSGEAKIDQSQARICLF